MCEFQIQGEDTFWLRPLKMLGQNIRFSDNSEDKSKKFPKTLLGDLISIRSDFSNLSADQSFQELYVYRNSKKVRQDYHFIIKIFMVKDFDVEKLQLVKKPLKLELKELNIKQRFLTIRSVTHRRFEIAKKNMAFQNYFFEIFKSWRQEIQNLIKTWISNHWRSWSAKIFRILKIIDCVQNLQKSEHK